MLQINLGCTNLAIKDEFLLFFIPIFDFTKLWHQHNLKFYCNLEADLPRFLQENRIVWWQILGVDVQISEEYFPFQICTWCFYKIKLYKIPKLKRSKNVKSPSLNRNRRAYISPTATYDENHELISNNCRCAVKWKKCSVRRCDGLRHSLRPHATTRWEFLHRRHFICFSRNVNRFE